MDKKRLFNISLFCGIFLWIIPSGIFYEVDKRIVLFYFGFHLIMSLLYLIQFRNVTRDKRNTQFEWVLIYLSTAGSILVHVITCVSLLFLKGNISNFKLIPIVLVLRCVVLTSIVVYRYSEYEEADLDKKIKEEKKLNSEKNKEKIRKKKNNKWIYKILLKDFRANLKNYTVFIISAVLTFTYVYGFLGNLFIIHNMQQTNMAQIGEGITSVVLNALIIITAVTILIQFYALKNYMQNRMYDFKTLILLGMKKKEIYKGLIFVLTISLLISYLIGVILGNGMIFIFRKVYGFYLQNTIIPKVDIIIVTAISFVICLVIIVFIMCIVQDMVIESGILNASNSNIEEQMPKFRKIIFVLTILLIILFVLYSDPHRAESLYLIYPCLIIFVIFTYFGAVYLLRKLKNNNKHYLNNILTFNLIYYKPKSYLKNSLALYTLLFVMFFTYIFQIATLFPLDSNKLYPYDYICLGYEEDKTEFENIKNQFDIESEIYPVARVTVPGGEDGGYGDFNKTLPMGHHLGISESTYKKLTGKNLNLKDKEICILYQEDKSNKAHPLDFYAIRSKPLIRIGQPQRYIPGTRKTFFSLDYDVVDERREVVLGRLTNVMYENIVVFSDEHFNSEYKKADGIKYLMTINSNMKDNKSLESYLDNYKKTHNEERKIDDNVQSVYKAKDLYESFQGEKIFTLIINTSILITFTIANIIIVFVHVFGNISYYKNRYEILSYLGEKRKNSNSIIRKEISLFAMRPCILAIITSLVFILITIKMRGFNYFEIITSAKIYISIMLAFLLVYGISTFIVYRCLIKEIGGK